MMRKPAMMRNMRMRMRSHFENCCELTAIRHNTRHGTNSSPVYIQSSLKIRSIKAISLRPVCIRA
jgi:hypothetical protein